MKFKCKCGWTGDKLEKTGCVTYADTWYVCPNCKKDASGNVTTNNVVSTKEPK